MKRKKLYRLFLVKIMLMIGIIKKLERDENSNGCFDIFFLDSYRLIYLLFYIIFILIFY